jgi:hypothetical protein
MKLNSGERVGSFPQELKSEATVPSARPVTCVKETKAMVLSAGPAYNVKKTEATFL